MSLGSQLINELACRRERRAPTPPAMAGILDDMNATWIKNVFWPVLPPEPRILYFEKLGNGIVLNCQIEVGTDYDSIQSVDGELDIRFEGIRF